LDIIYFGSSDFSVPFLEALDGSSHKVNRVFTYGDKKRGRGRRASANPVKACAGHRGLKVYEIDTFGRDFYEELSRVPFEYAVVVSFGMILPQKMFETWPGIWINVHPSMLPEYRGPSPMITALLEGAGTTGVTINRIVYQVDAGDIYAQTSFNIEDDDNLDRLEEKAAALGAPLLVAVLDLIEKLDYRPVPQGTRGVTYSSKITPGDLVIDWTRPAGELFNRIRAFSTRPGAYTIFNGSRLKILSSHIAERDAAGKEPGMVIAAGKKEGVIVACGDGNTISLDRLQPQGKRPMDAPSFVNGYSISTGTILGKE
jgi:methionyl-tRNA formyltransferase